MTFSALILAGGKSARMGQDKAWLRLGNETFLARQIRLAHEVGASEVLISGRANTDYSNFGCPVLRDEIPHSGPLAGIERGLSSISTPMLLVLAVDLQAMGAQHLLRIAAQGLGAGAIPIVAGHIEPLAAFYPRQAWSLAETLLRGHDKAVATFATHCVQANLARFVECRRRDARFFLNCNRPADLVLLAGGNSRPA